MSSVRSNSDRSSRSSRFSLSSLFYEHVGPRRTLRSSTFESDRGVNLSKTLTGKSDTLSKRSDSLSEDGSSSIQSSVRKQRNRNVLECPLCLQILPKEKFPILLTCHHRSCIECLRQYLKIEVTESRTNIECPECAEQFHPNDIQNILGNNIWSQKYEEFMLRRVLVSDPDVRWCPAPDCGYAVIAVGCASCPKINCEKPGCKTSFCYHCKQHWHPNQTCDAAKAERFSGNQLPHLTVTDQIHKDSVKPCPKCATLIVKMDDGSCNHMTCAMCGSEFCWLCMQEISDLHYLSPSGCTFWGKKRWSRKKKVLWQLGMLAGAPIGITLIAGVAVPAIIIGLPVWVGRKLYSLNERTPKHKRNGIIVGGVLGTVLISPIMAALAVAIGVPILLAYVYGVVPVSLCRSGGCASGNDADKITVEFENSNETANIPSVHYEAAEVVTLIGSRRFMNPSIGPSIGEISLGNSLSISGSNIDRIGALWEEASDHKSSSQRAVAGESREGSVIGSTYQAMGSSSARRLEVGVEIVDDGRHRSSLCSDDPSIDVRSVTISMVDNGSIRALAGSICARESSVHCEVSSSASGVPLLAKTQFSYESPVSTPSVNFDEATMISRKSSANEGAAGLSYRGDDGSTKSPSLSLDSGHALVDASRNSAEGSQRLHSAEKGKGLRGQGVLLVNERSGRYADESAKPVELRSAHVYAEECQTTAGQWEHGTTSSTTLVPCATLCASATAEKQPSVARIGFPFRLTGNRRSKSVQHSKPVNI